jgi:glycosyltransferase involved in cell wall biosynthesis
MPGRTAVPVVVTVHDLTFLDHPEWHERGKVQFFRHAIRRAAAEASAVVCVSQHTADILGRRLSVHGPVFVVPHGVDHERFRPDPPDPASDEQVLAQAGAHRPYLLFLGTLEPRKAVPDLVRAFSVVARHHPELMLVLAGHPGWGSNDVDRAVLESGLGGRVRRMGYVAETWVPALLRQAAAVVYPAREEGFGLPALEALACGAPLVTTTGTAMADLAGAAAWLVPPGVPVALAQALDEVLSGGAAVEQRRRAGMAVAAEYTWERSAAGHAAAYRWAAEAARSPSRRT